ncbi:tRNA synthetases class II (D, K and n) domain-containing protein [Phthorimaea operculella]|nr:tRNA synthetases class II (D, K and n) domain-containing protein [Phthorimaea operculella]
MIFLMILLCGAKISGLSLSNEMGRPQHHNHLSLQIEEPYKPRILETSNDAEFYEKRAIETYKEFKGNPYPSDFIVSKTVDEFYTTFFTKNGNKSKSIAGRVYRIRKNTSNETIYDIKSENDDFTLQAIVNARNYDSYDKYESDTAKIQRGDIVGVVGYADEKIFGNMTFHANHIRLLAPCLHLMPLNMDEENRFSLRYLDFIINKKMKEVFHKRAEVISTIRQFLDDRGYLEVETPILNKVPGGAKAPSFKTHNDAEDSDWHLRISPEHYHKMLIVGGFNKVYEIGRQFRNEKSDSIHNPEFTTLEFYTAYTNYTAETLNSIESYKFLYDLCIKHNVKLPTARTSANLLGMLLENIIVANIVQPTFVTDYPEIFSPLAKSNPNSPGLTERFELFALGKELANAYVELNDPRIQRERFAQQDADRAAGDDEIPPTDEDFITALEYGLPPTAGVGMGIDRIVMFLTNATSIKDVILFPNTKT